MLAKIESLFEFYSNLILLKSNWDYFSAFDYYDLLCGHSEWLLSQFKTIFSKYDFEERNFANKGIDHSFNFFIHEIGQIGMIEDFPNLEAYLKHNIFEKCFRIMRSFEP